MSPLYGVPGLDRSRRISMSISSIDVPGLIARSIDLVYRSLPYHCRSRACRSSIDLVAVDVVMYCIRVLSISSIDVVLFVYATRRPMLDLFYRSVVRADLDSISCLSTSCVDLVAIVA